MSSFLTKMVIMQRRRLLFDAFEQNGRKEVSPANIGRASTEEESSSGTIGMRGWVVGWGMLCIEI